MPGGLDEKRRSSLVVWRFDPTDSTTVNIAKLPTATHDAAVAAIGDTVWMMGGASRTAKALDATVAIDAAGAVSSPANCRPYGSTALLSAPLTGRPSTSWVATTARTT